MRNLLLLFPLCIACGHPSPPTTTPQTIAQPEPPAPEDETTAVEPAPPIADAVRPAFLDVEPALRVTRIRRGIVRATPDGEVINDPSDGAVLWHYPVLEPDHEGDAPHPRIQCANEIARVALHLDASSLATVALTGAAIRLDAAATPSEDEPGVRLAPGARLEVLERGEAVSGVRFRGFMIEAEGLVDTARIGNVFAPAAFVVSTWNAELREGARFLDAPRGRTIAVLEPYPNDAQRHFATIVGRPRNGHTLLRFTASDVRVTGWVESRHVTPVGEQSGSGMDGLGIGGGRRRFVRPVTLPVATRLLDGASGRWIGVLNEETELECLEACDTPSPRVQVPTCVGDVRLWTAPPT